MNFLRDHAVVSGVLLGGKLYLGGRALYAVTDILWRVLGGVLIVERHILLPVQQLGGRFVS